MNIAVALAVVHVRAARARLWPVQALRLDCRVTGEVLRRSIGRRQANGATPNPDPISGGRCKIQKISRCEACAAVTSARSRPVESVGLDGDFQNHETPGDRRGARTQSVSTRGTDGSNPPPSSGESPRNIGFCRTHSARRGAGSGRLITGSRPERSASRGYPGLARARQTKLIFMMLPLRLLPRKRANVMEYRGEPFAVLNRILASSPKRPDRAHRGCERQGSENYSLASP